MLEVGSWHLSNQKTRNLKWLLENLCILWAIDLDFMPLNYPVNRIWFFEKNPRLYSFMDVFGIVILGAKTIAYQNHAYIFGKKSYLQIKIGIE